MEYISAEEFLKQDKEVQKVFKEYYDQEIMLYSFNNTINYGVFDDIIDEVPLLTEGQLRKFIEDKTDWKVSVINTGSRYRLVLEELKNHLFYDKLEFFTQTEESIFQAYWKVALEIAKAYKR